MEKNYVFISHSTRDDGFVKELRKNLETRGYDAWVDSRELVDGNKLEPEIKKAVENAHAFIVVFSPHAHNSPWILKEVKLAREMEKKKGKDYPVIPLLLEGVEPAALNLYFDEERLGRKVTVGPGGITEALPHIFAALGERLPDDHQPMLRPEPKPPEELLLELTDPVMVEKDGTRRARATAKLTYIPGPGQKGKRHVESNERFLFTAPMGPIEGEELSWYLERYYLWPTGVFRERAEKVEALLPLWGKALYDAVLNHESVGDVPAAWKDVATKAGTERRFTVYVDSKPVRGAEGEKQAEADEAAALLLGLPWELLHDDKGYLFQGARPVRVRRRLPFTRLLAGTVSEPPIRVLLVSPRPEDESAGYIDHRVSALPLVTALENLGDLARLTVLSPPTFPALQRELERALAVGEPYQVVHFDGHGVFRRHLGLGGLCFEEPGDSKKLEKRKSKIIDAKEMAGVLRDHRVPLVFLEACQTAKTEDDPTASVAAALLDAGVASVVAMSHSVLVETARRFVERFYGELAAGSRVGKAMLAGQRALKSDGFRMKVFGAGRLEMEDWFVPVLYQEEEDLQLLTVVPSGEMGRFNREGLERRFGALPGGPGHEFIGRSRELLRLERLLERVSYVVVSGQGGEGKTTLVVELGRWLVRTGRFYRMVFVSMEDVYDVRTVVDRVGRQLTPNYSVAEFSEGELLGKAIQSIERQLRDDRTLIVFDNMESILPSASLNKSFSGVQGAVFQKSPLERFEPGALKLFFDFCKRLESVEGTCLVFTTREALPRPFDAEFHRVVLGRLDKWDAVDLVHRAMTASGLEPMEDDTGRAQPGVEALVEAVNCHARSLVLLAPYISRLGVRHTTEDLGRLMAELDKKFPDERERSLFASVELSLRRLSPDIREKIRPLGVFQGGGHLSIIANVLELSEEERDLLLRELVQINLAEAMAYGFFRFHPALCPYLLRELPEAELTRSTARWAESMRQLSGILLQQQSEDAQLSATLTTLELPNLVRLLGHVRAQEEPEATLKIATKLETLIAQLGRPHLLARVAAIRESEAKKLGDWSHALFGSSRMQIERLLGKGNFPGALQEARALLDRCLQVGESAYPIAAYNTAMAYKLFGQVLKKGGASEAALQPIDEAYRRFQRLAEEGSNEAAGMASKSLTEKGDCLCDLGRLEEAAEAYEEGIKTFKDLGDSRGAAVNKIQLGTVRMYQKRYDDALNAYDEALKIFENLGEPATVAVIWHQIGIVHEDANRFEAAEQAYRQSLAISVQQNNSAYEAATLNQLGQLYDKMGRIEESAIFVRQAADKYVEINDMANEGRARNNLAMRLIKLKRYDDARRAIHRAIECKKPYGHAAGPWKTWNILYDLEHAEGNREAAEVAREKAIQLYLAYRRDGGENHEPGGRLCFEFLHALQENKTGETAALLEQLLNHPEIHSSLKPLIPKLQAILAGSRDPGLAENPSLNYRDTAEILFLLEHLEV